MGFLLRWAHWIAATALVAMFILSFVIYQRASGQLLEFAVVTSVRSTSDLVEAFRTLYTEQVVRKVGPLGIEATHDHKERPTTIPLPATFSIELGELLGARSGIKTDIYSPYPFPWRQARGDLDAFQREAWALLSENPDEPVYRVEELDGVLSIRYATADLMRAACLDCHNSHPDSPKTDWREGDLRGEDQRENAGDLKPKLSHRSSWRGRSPPWAFFPR